MKKIFLFYFIISFYFYPQDAQSQIWKATCTCDVQCSFADGSTHNQSTNWTRRPNGKKYRGILTRNEWNDCQSQCNSYASGINAEALAAEKKACGPWKCTPTAKLGTKWGPEVLQQATGNYSDPNICGGSPSGESKNSIYSYASKVVCGLSKPINITGDIAGLSVDRVVPGIYGTAVNVHNPNFEDVFFRWKIAPAGKNQDLGHSEYSDEIIKPDNARFYDCSLITKSPELFDGFLVVESDKPLDVSTYFTATKVDISKPEKQIDVVPAIDVETTKERIVAGPDNWGCKANFKSRITGKENWVLENGSPAIVTNNSGTISYASDEGVDGSLKPGNYIYDYNFCLCPGGKAEVAISSLRTDDGVDVEMLPSSTSGNSAVFSHPITSQFPNNFLAFSTASIVSGQNVLRLNVKQKDFGGNNIGNATSATINGSIAIQNGYLGQCMARHIE